MAVLYVQSKNIWQLLAFYLTFISSHSRLLAHILSCIYFYSFKTFDTFVVLFYLDAYRSLKCWSGGVKGLPRRVTEGVQPNATNKLYFHLFLKPYCGHCFELKTSSCFCKHFEFNLFYQMIESVRPISWEKTWCTWELKPLSSFGWTSLSLLCNYNSRNWYVHLQSWNTNAQGFCCWFCYHYHI